MNFACFGSANLPPKAAESGSSTLPSLASGSGVLNHTGGMVGVSPCRGL